MRHPRLLGMALTVAAASMLSVAVQAAPLCSEPLKPICIEEDSTYQSKATTERCRADLDRYTGEMESYLDCLRQMIRESKDALDSAKDEFAERAES